MLVIHASAPEGIQESGSVRYVGLGRSRLSIRLEKDLRFDLAFVRHLGRALDELRKFQPDVVHVTGPSDVGLLGTVAARQLGIPLAASWHTNVHEYAATRLDRILPHWLIRGGVRAGLLHALEEAAFRILLLQFRLARFHYAPNEELIARLREATGKPCWPMGRGINQELFRPERRTRTGDGACVIGYVGRLSSEKKIRSFGPLADAIRQAGHRHVRFVFVGHGKDEGWIKQNIPEATLTGVLKGEALAQAYADLDLFVFFSETDTFGNVVLEALASGVPALVSDKGGPKFIVDGHCGMVCRDDEEFARAALQLIGDESMRRDLSMAARKRAEQASWSGVFDAVYSAYEQELREGREPLKQEEIPSACFTPDA